MNPILALLTAGVPEIVVLPFVIAWIWAVVDCLFVGSRTKNEKIVWIVALLLLNLISAIVYWIMRFAARVRSTSAEA